MYNSILNLYSALGALNIDINTDPSKARPGATLHLEVAIYDAYLPIHNNAICKLKVHSEMQIRPRFRTLMYNKTEMGALNINNSTNPSIASVGPILRLEVAKLYDAYIPLHDNGICKLKDHNEMHAYQKWV